MDLLTVREVERLEKGATAPVWREGDAWLAGGTWLYSEPQVHLRRLLDLGGLGWEPLTVTDAGIEIAATCPIARIEHFAPIPEWPATALFQPAARALLMSFKIQRTATVGGNVCMSLPAGAMISLTAALEGVCTIHRASGEGERVPVTEFVTGDHKNVLNPGDLLRSIHLPASALRKRAAHRRMAMTHEGRSSVFVLATRGESGDFTLTVTASTFRPVQIAFDALPDAAELRGRLLANVSDSLWFNDVHGTPEYRKHMTLYFAEGLRQELGA